MTISSSRRARAEALKSKADQAFAAGATGKTIQALSKVVELAPDFAEALAERARCRA
jgi:hypothetical protein